MALTLDDIKKMSPQQKVLFVFLIYILLGYFFYFYFLQTDLEKRGNLRPKLQELDQQMATKERLAGELGKYIKGVDVLKGSFQTALTKLPIREEVPELLHSVAQSGEKAGVIFTLFEPQPTTKKQIGGKEAPDQKAAEQKSTEQKPPEPKPPDKKDGEGKAPPKPAEEGDFYEEIPVKVAFDGSYHNTTAFFAKVANLPRIINIEDITMANAKAVSGKKSLLNISCVIKTYMFVQKKDEIGKKADEKKP